MATIKDEQIAKDFLRVDKTNMPKKELAEKFGLTATDVAKERAKWTDLLNPSKKNATNGNGNGHKPAKPKKTVKAKAPTVSVVVARQQMIAALKAERERIDETIALLETV
jgi:hypothetical protein